MHAANNASQTSAGKQIAKQPHRVRMWQSNSHFRRCIQCIPACDTRSVSITVGVDSTVNSVETARVDGLAVAACRVLFLAT